MSFADTAVLFILALLLFGPKKLPGIARQVGKALSEFKRASNEFKAQIESEISQLELQEKEKERLQKESAQKTLPPAEPPAGSVEYTRPHADSSPSEPAAPSHNLSLPAQNTNNA